MSTAVNIERHDLTSASEADCDIAFVGGGFRTTTFLASSPQLLSRKIRIIERGSSIGPGAFVDYTANSTSYGSRFLRGISMDDDITSKFQTPDARELAHSEHPVPLSQVAKALSQIGHAITTTLGESQVALNTLVKSVDIQSLGGPIALVGSKGTIARAKHVVVATGRAERLHPALARWRHKVVLSNAVIRHSHRQEVEGKLAGLSGQTVVIVGSSHSAMSALSTLLNIRSNLELRDVKILVLQRAPARLMYENVEAAKIKQIPDREVLFRHDRDICPATGVVFRDSGLRHESRNLYCTLWAGGLPGVDLVRATLDDANHIFDQAGIIIQALGYRGRAPDIRIDGKIIRSGSSVDRLSADDDGSAILDGSVQKALSVLRVEPTPVDRRDNGVYGAELYQKLAAKLATQFEEA